MQPFEPHKWFWIVGGDESRAWSSEEGGWVASWEADRLSLIASLAELDEVLRRHGLASPIVTADDVRAGASRRMQALVGARDQKHLDIIISNATREAVRLLRKGPQNWSPSEIARVKELEAADAGIEAIRSASNAIESDPPANCRDDALWPSSTVRQAPSQLRIESIQQAHVNRSHERLN
jgi:hypothetical protein